MLCMIDNYQLYLFGQMDGYKFQHVIQKKLFFPIKDGSMYPLDPLTEKELESISEYFLENILKNVQVPDEAVFDSVILLEPPKKAMLAFNAGGPRPPRKAEVPIWFVKSDKYLTYVVVLEDEEVEHVSNPEQICRGRPAYSCVDDGKAVEAVLANKKFRDSLKKRGLTDYDIDNNVFYDVSIDGRLDDCKCKLNCERSFSVIKKTKPRPHSFVISPYWNDGDPGSTSAYIQPISGVFAIYDARCDRVLKVVDTCENYPIQKGNLDWERPVETPLKPMAVGFPDGPGYTRNGYEIEWQGWKLRFGFSAITGLILYQISILDPTVWVVDKNAKPVRRSVLYRANVTELITGYGGTNEPVVARNFFDIAEYPAREFVPPLVKGIDVPPYAELISVPSILADGEIFVQEDAIGIYEETDGMLWRHADYSCVEDVRIRGRSSRRLVLATTHTIGNYDYAMYWKFDQAGRIEFEMKATGCLETEAVPEAKVHGHDHHDEIEEGTLIRPYVLGVNHWHLANLRLDFDIDGVKNRVEEKDIVLIPVGKENPCGNLFTETHKLLKTECKAVRDTDFAKGRKWAVKNHDSKNYLGHDRGYELEPFPVASPLVQACQRVAKRATYLKHDLFVTKYRENELYSVGRYPIERGHDTGLPCYIQNNDSIVDEDIVLWYTVGFGHSPITEEYPVMPYESVKMFLKPHNFFNENPALYISETNLVDCPENS